MTVATEHQLRESVLQAVRRAEGPVTVTGLLDVTELRQQRDAGRSILPTLDALVADGSITREALPGQRFTYRIARSLVETVVATNSTPTITTRQPPRRHQTAPNSPRAERRRATEARILRAVEAGVAGKEALAER